MNMGDRYVGRKVNALQHTSVNQPVPVTSSRVCPRRCALTGRVLIGSFAESNNRDVVAIFPKITTFCYICSVKT